MCTHIKHTCTQTALVILIPSSLDALSNFLVWLVIEQQAVQFSHSSDIFSRVLYQLYLCCLCIYSYFPCNFLFPLFCYEVFLHSIHLVSSDLALLTVQYYKCKNLSTDIRHSFPSVCENSLCYQLSVHQIVPQFQSHLSSLGACQIFCEKLNAVKISDVLHK